MLRGLEGVDRRSARVCSSLVHNMSRAARALFLLLCLHVQLGLAAPIIDLTITQCTADPKCAGAVALTCGVISWVVRVLLTLSVRNM